MKRALLGVFLLVLPVISMAQANPLIGAWERVSALRIRRTSRLCWSSAQRATSPIRRFHLVARRSMLWRIERDELVLSSPDPQNKVENRWKRVRPVG
jgi:hypothetical protein